MAAAGPRVVRVLRLAGYPILRQLQLEEALLRATPHNWFLINDGVQQPAVVLGISGRVPELVDAPAAAAAHIPLIRRFTGGGTVVLDGDSLMTALVMSEASVPGLQPYPRPVMRWTESLYAPAFAGAAPGSGSFRLRENDYVLGGLKFGGNAQAITKGRWVHHTSMLWDFQPDRMQLLHSPARAPEYRQGRHHLDFLVRLRDVLPCRQALADDLCASLAAAGFELQRAELAEAEEAIGGSPLCSSRLLAPDGT